MSQSAAFVRLFAGFLLCAAGVHASCPIELNPPSVVVKYGDPVSINCTALEDEHDGMGWEASQNGTDKKQTQHLTWRVDQLKEWDITTMCYINLLKDGFPEQCSKDANVVVYTFPENISISSSDARGATENKEYNLTCEIQNVAPVKNLTVKWYRGDAIVQSHGFDDLLKEAVNEASVFSFKPTRQDSGVTFRCEAHLDLGPEGPYFSASSPNITVEVFYGPEVSCDGSVKLQEGATLDQKCPVTGNPSPSVEWLKNEELVNSTVPLNRNDKGMYRLKAEGHSFLDKPLEVFVNYGPTLTCPSFYTAKENSLNQLNCTFDGLPSPEITWYKDDEKVDRPENLTKSDKGQYVITASNIVSNVSQTVEIDVTYPPSQIFELEDSEVDVGSTIGLKCASASHPRPKYSWDYYRTANVIEENEDGVSRLVIHNATAHNIGTYVCHVWNDEGRISKTARLTVKGAEPACPIEISPENLVIPRSETGRNVTCKPSSTDSRNYVKIQWEDLGNKYDSRTWSSKTADWYSSPVCKAEFVRREECNKTLNFTFYKQPDNVSIHTDSDEVVENNEFQLRCDINNVAPVKNLVVWWNISGSRTKGEFQVRTCREESDTDCRDINKSRSPVDVSSTLNVTVKREENGTEVTCWAQLDFGSHGPPNLTTTSRPLNIIVQYRPSINTTKLPEKIPLIGGYSEDLFCEADGYPPPKIEWSFSPDLTAQRSEGNLTVSEAGRYNCTATNSVGSISHEVEVIFKADYLPLIAGFVAVAVVAISIIFVFIYSIYYKNTKMRRYSLKNPKLNTHNGNVAHNGWDLQFPMTKLC